MKNEKIAVFATLGKPFSFYMIKNMLDCDIQIDCIILDGKRCTEKDLSIWNDRTKGKFPLSDFSIFENYNIPTFFFKNHCSASTESFLKNRDISLIINAGTPRILKNNIISIPTRGVLNVHPGILPKYRGCTVVEWSIYNDDKVGATAHFMTEGIDEGPIILTEEYSFLKGDSYSGVRIKVYENSFSLMSKAIKHVITNDCTSNTMKNQGEGSYFKVMKDDLLLQVKKKLELGMYKYQE